MMQKQDLWGPVANDSGTPVECTFEDSFSPQCLSSGHENFVGNEDYVPLEDSKQYIAGLERRLACVQGHSANRRQTESRRLIDALVGSRDAHAHELVNASDLSNEETITSESEPALQSGAVDPQGALGAMIRRIVPDKVALTHEELCQLLEADFLSKIQEAAAAAEEQAKDRVHYDQIEEKKLSSDEGEK